MLLLQSRPPIGVSDQWQLTNRMHFSVQFSIHFHIHFQFSDSQFVWRRKEKTRQTKEINQCGCCCCCCCFGRAIVKASQPDRRRLQGNLSQNYLARTTWIRCRLQGGMWGENLVREISHRFFGFNFVLKSVSKCHMLWNSLPQELQLLLRHLCLITRGKLSSLSPYQCVKDRQTDGRKEGRKERKKERK